MTDNLDINMSATIITEKLQKEDTSAQTLSDNIFQIIYWTPTQTLTHHASNSCKLKSRDLFCSGTVSGVERTSCTTLAELRDKGKSPVQTGGETRTIMEDGDEVIFHA